MRNEEILNATDHSTIIRKVLIDGQKLNEEISTVSPWCDREILVGYVCEKDNGMRNLVKPVDENNIRDWGYCIGECPVCEKAEITEIPLDSRLSPDCPDCNSREVYHDSRQEYFCPWCDDP